MAVSLTSLRIHMPPEPGLLTLDHSRMTCRLARYSADSKFVQNKIAKPPRTGGCVVIHFFLLTFSFTTGSAYAPKSQFCMVCRPIGYKNVNRSRIAIRDPAFSLICHRVPKNVCSDHSWFIFTQVRVFLAIYNQSKHPKTKTPPKSGHREAEEEEERKKEERNSR